MSTMEEEARRRLTRVTPRQVRTGEICAICRHRCPPQGRSVCDVCVPPEESEIKERCRSRSLADELREVQASCEEHVRIRNEQGEYLLKLQEEHDRAAKRVGELERALRYAAECSTLEMVRDTARGMGVIQ